MTQINHDFLKGGDRWSSSIIANLGFNFVSSTHSDVTGLSNFDALFDTTVSGTAFTGTSSATVIDQEDVTRFLLLNPSAISVLSGGDTIAKLNGVTGLTDEDALVAGGNLILV